MCCAWEESRAMNSYTLSSHISKKKTSCNSPVHSQPVRFLVLCFTLIQDQQSLDQIQTEKSFQSMFIYLFFKTNKHRCHFKPLHKQHVLFPFFAFGHQVHIRRDYTAIIAYIWLAFESSYSLRLTRNSDVLQIAWNASGHDERLWTTVTDALWHPCINNVISGCWKFHYS